MSVPPAGPTLWDRVHWHDPTGRCAESMTCATKNLVTCTCEDDAYASAIPFPRDRSQTPRPPGVRPTVRPEDCARGIQQARLRSDLDECPCGQPGNQQI